MFAARFSITHKEINNTNSLLPSSCNWSLFLLFVLSTLFINENNKSNCLLSFHT